jgi:hypothetical protein
MRSQRLNRINTDWDDRNLFHRRRRWVRYVWLTLLIATGMTLYFQRDEIPDLLLDGFKLIAHAIPVQQPVPLNPSASEN